MVSILFLHAHQPQQQQQEQRPKLKNEIKRKHMCDTNWNGTSAMRTNNDL